MSAYKVEIIELQYVDPRANHDKFYRTFAVGSELVTQYGRNGSYGTFGHKALHTCSAARDAADKTVASKLAKGYEQTVRGVVSFEHLPSESELDRAAGMLPAGHGRVTVPAARPAAMPTVATATPGAPAASAIPVTSPAFERVVAALSATRVKRGPIPAPSGPTRPMLAETVAAQDLEGLLDDDEWVCQIKLDGDRVVIEVVDGVVSALNRAGQPKVKNVGEAHLAPFHNLTSGRWVFDGEVVGRTLWLFDMAAAGDFFDENTRFDERHGALRAVIGQPGAVTESIGVVGVAEGSAAKRALLEDARIAGKEGVMFRHLGHPYEPGRRSAGLLKHKFTHDADCVVTACDPVKSSVTLGVYDDAGEMVEVGAASVIGKGGVAVGDVVEVRFLYVTDARHPRMYQPRIVSVRHDKTAAECSIDQFAGAVTDKSVEMAP